MTGRARRGVSVECPAGSTPPAGRACTIIKISADPGANSLPTLHLGATTKRLKKLRLGGTLALEWLDYDKTEDASWLRAPAPGHRARINRRGGGKGGMKWERKPLSTKQSNCDAQRWRMTSDVWSLVTSRTRIDSGCSSCCHGHDVGQVAAAAELRHQKTDTGGLSIDSAPEPARSCPEYRVASYCMDSWSANGVDSKLLLDTAPSHNLCFCNLLPFSLWSDLLSAPSSSSSSSSSNLLHLFLTNFIDSALLLTVLFKFHSKQH